MSIARGYNTVLNKGKHVKSINFFNAQFVWSIDTNYQWRNMADFYSNSFLNLFEYRIDFSAIGRTDIFTGKCSTESHCTKSSLIQAHDGANLFPSIEG